MKILVIRFSSIGDIVLTSPVVRCLHKQLDAEVHYLTKKNFATIVEANPHIASVHVLEDSLLETIIKLRNEQYDYIIDLHHNLRSFIVKSILLRKSYSYRKLNVEKWLYTNWKWKWLPDIHIVDRYLATCHTLGVVNDGQGLDYFLRDDEQVSVQTLPAGFQEGYIAWVIGAKQKTKQFPPEKIISVLQSPSFPALPVLLLGGKEDASTAEKITSVLPTKMLFNACGKFSLNQSASLVQQALLVITNDTGLMHISAAFHKPILSIWGNTSPDLGMKPYYGKNKVPNFIAEVKNLACRPCSKLGYAQCPRQHFFCMLQQDENELIAQLHLLLA